MKGPLSFFCCQPGETQDEPSYLPLETKDFATHELLVEVLAVGGRVDFPVVTEICERACGNAVEMLALVHLLASSLQETYDRDLSKQLKVVTVLHELLYDKLAQQVMIETPGLVVSLQKLRKHSLSSSAGLAREPVLILASEILKQLLSGQTWPYCC